MPPATQTALKRGVKKGGYNPGGFKSGHDRRRANMQNTERTHWRDELAEKLGEHVPAAVRFLADSVVDENLPPAVRMEAATQILDRRFGRAVTRDVQVVIGQPKDAPQEGDISLLSTQELMRIAAGGLNDIEGEAEVVSATLEHNPED